MGTSGGTEDEALRRDIKLDLYRDDHGGAVYFPRRFWGQGYAVDDIDEHERTVNFANWAFLAGGLLVLATALWRFFFTGTGDSRLNLTWIFAVAFAAYMSASWWSRWRVCRELQTHPLRVNLSRLVLRNATVPPGKGQAGSIYWCGLFSLVWTALTVVGAFHHRCEWSDLWWPAFIIPGWVWPGYIAHVHGKILQGRVSSIPSWQPWGVLAAALVWWGALAALTWLGHRG